MAAAPHGAAHEPVGLGTDFLVNRWWILAVLFLARMTMAFQFQSVAALSPLLVDAYGLGLGDIGLLIGLYLAPGVIVALPGGAIAARFGDKRVVTLAMVLMLIGGGLIAFGPGWGTLVAGRVLAGAGGVVVNIVMTKMLVDWFVGREISTAMAIFVNSWPVGIALALLSLPWLAAADGLGLAWAAVLGVIAAGLAMFSLVYRAPDGADADGADAQLGVWVARFPAWPLVLAGLIWALYNSALAMVFSFGPVLLAERGWVLTAASSATSLFMILVAVGIPVGGYLADRSGRRDGVILFSRVGSATLMSLVPGAPAVAVPGIFLLLGLVLGLAAGPIMTLPSQVLQPEARAFGMGLFFTLYYVAMMVAPTLAGAIAERVGSAGAAFFLGAAILALGAVVLGLFRRAAAALNPVVGPVH
jgi:MFS family permease